MRKPVRRDDPETRILCRAAAELRLAFTRKGFTAPFPFFHCPNEGKLPVQYRAKLHDKGLERGVPDLVIAWPCAPNVPGAALELKAPGKKATPEQESWLGYFKAIGWFTEVAVGHVKTATILASLGYIDPVQARTWIEWAERSDRAGL